ncbi:MAG TPA: DUF2142 domain-containing protein [Solirubrobacteraceae bacterium]|jgi:hypothetical protein|nr:DUF2142 domain-containing protein [Solirubrobacteraceae bacterium]
MASHEAANAPGSGRAARLRRGRSTTALSPPGRVVAAAAVTATVFAGLILWQLLIPRTYYTGTNSVGTASVVATIPAGQELCVPELKVPSGTGGVRLALFSPQPSVRAAVTVIEGARRVSTVATAATGGGRANLLAYGNLAPSSGGSTTPATVCVAPLNGPVGVGGTAALQYGQLPAVLRARQMLPAPRSSAKDHVHRTSAPAQLASRISVWFVPPAGSKRSLLASLGTIFVRAALFRPGIVGPWTYPVLLFVVLPATWLLALLTLFRAAAGRDLRIGGRRLRTALAVGLIAFVNAGCWALITPAFQTPDEPDHFAYVQYLAETGHQPSKVTSGQGSFSTEQVLGLNAVNAFSTISNSEARPPWLKSNERRWEQLRDQLVPHPKNNGGGYTPAAAIHDPPYYALGAIGYAIAKGESVFSQLTAVRLISALLGAIVAMCAFGAVRELAPRQRLAAVAAGLLVAYHPMFGFISGAVNDDSGVNAAAAVSLYLLIRGLRRGLGWRGALGLGVALAITPLMKETGYEIYPAAAVGLLGLLWRQLRARRTGRGEAEPVPAAQVGSPEPALAKSLPPVEKQQGSPRWSSRMLGWVALAAGFVAIIVAWAIVKPHVLHGAVGGTGAETAGGVSATGSVSLAEHMPGRFAVYLWELFLPRLSFMGTLFPPGWPFFQVYIQRGWASFGWYTFDFPHWVYAVIVIAMATIGLLAIGAAWRHRRWVAGHGWELLVIVLFPVCTLLAVEAAFFIPTGGRVVVAEQGRYIFPAIAALAAIAIGGTFGVGRRWQAPLATVLVVAMIGMSFASQLLTLGSFYT